MSSKTFLNLLKERYENDPLLNHPPKDFNLKYSNVFWTQAHCLYVPESTRVEAFRLTSLQEIQEKLTNTSKEAQEYYKKAADRHRRSIPTFHLDKDYLQTAVSSNLTIHLVTEFIIFGFPSLQSYHILLFCVFLFIYLFTVTGNGSIFFLVILDQRLHTPMYFFVSNLSFLDLSYTSVTIPKMLAKFSMHLNTISYAACFTQMYFFLSLAATECLLLTIMAYDRYVAICSPLHYQTIMTRRRYLLLASLAWSGGFLIPVTILILALNLPFCGPNIIHHYYCDHPPLLQLACTNTSFNVAVGSSIGAFVLLITFTLVVVSYIKIILTILKIDSKDGRKKTFSTCASHFVVVNMFFLPLIFMYVRPKASYSSDVDSLVAMLYTVLTPLMNPVIYSFRNRDIKEAFRKKVHL
ncbi:olfactory receptor 6N1-like [Bufo gargarizans]|uniref:olfactory receptor 6N1-like n=1 Tax=Bufo gargarizans TaxID=30331 RepID=UPI001CF15834|nr:olfactory receptor 6N1-like [Bufo gargarizans]